MARLDESGLSPSPPADKATLIRRVTLDLTGLPPSPVEVDAFFGDQRPEAFERVVDRLLSSPRYGEHMAASWLDVARYADTDGYQNDRLRYMHAWRDWVIDAFNSNLPYDQFVVEQIAGDMIPQATMRQQIATGFCRNHRINSEGGSIPDEWRVEYVADRLETTATAFLGLTVGCARCHDHKFDPISQEEYYRLFAYFNNIPEWGAGPNNGNSPPFIEVQGDWRIPASIPEPLQLREVKEAPGMLRPQAGGPKTVMVMHELSERRPTYLLLRGRYDQRDTTRPLAPGIPAALASDGQAAPRDRYELALWMVNPRNPLTARVAVNRIWQQFFGVGLVRTPEDFGTQGDAPTHPELLDWLATEFMRTDWNVKRMQRAIVTSATYRQSSRLVGDLGRIDPDNRLLARGPRIRLPAFVVRDQALAAAGLLVEELGGPPVKPYMPADIWTDITNTRYEADHGGALFRRSLYTYWRRTTPPPLMRTFDAPSRDTCTVGQERTNTPLQALSLSNNITFVEAARCLADRMIRDGGSEAEAQISQGVRLVVGREPSSDELALLVALRRSFLAKFHSRPDNARELLAVGEKLRDLSLDPAEHAAMTLVASLLLNLDEAITKE